MSISDQLNEFTFTHAAELMALGSGSQGTNSVAETEIKLVKKRVLDAYECSVAAYEKMLQGDDPAAYKTQNPVGGIKSVKMQACERLVEHAPHWDYMSEWIYTNDIDIASQTFSREEIGRWIIENNIPSRYQFIDAQPVVSLTPATITKAARSSQNSGLQEPTVPQQRSAAQNSAILQIIKNLGHEPQRFPPNPRGKPGVKAEVKQVMLKNSKLFTEKSFEHAWERLTKSGEIVIVKGVSP